MNSQNKIRDAIKKINSDTSLTSNQKNIAIQKLMYNKNNNILTVNNNILTLNNPDKPCSHYLTKLCKSFYFSCCNSFYNCMRCHNEVVDHNPSLEAIKCSTCEFIQPASNKCCNDKCNTIFDVNYCDKCFLWTNKDIYHCDECGICRIGTKDGLFHCNKCDMCFNVTSSLNKNNHICANITYRDKICSYCMDNIYTSQDASLPLRCGHIVHQSCMNNAIKSGEYRCATCRKTMYKVDWTVVKDMIRMQPMPLEQIKIGDIVKCGIMYNKEVKITKIRNNSNDSNITNNSNDNNQTVLYEAEFLDIMSGMKGVFNRNALIKEGKKIEIYCNDCDTKSIAEFHYAGHECKKCGSFNTG